MTEQVETESLRTHEEINQKIKRDDAAVVTADEFVAHVTEDKLEVVLRCPSGWVGHRREFSSAPTGAFD